MEHCLGIAVKLEHTMLVGFTETIALLKETIDMASGGKGCSCSAHDTETKGSPSYSNETTTDAWEELEILRKLEKNRKKPPKG